MWADPHDVDAVLRAKGLSADDIQAKWYFDFHYFATRVPRTAPSSSILYERVRTVFKTFGPLADPETGKPLFNDQAWSKANNILKEILAGNGSDIPGEVYYSNKINSRGEVMHDSDGIPLIESHRGTNKSENARTRERTRMRKRAMALRIDETETVVTKLKRLATSIHMNH